MDQSGTASLSGRLVEHQHTGVGVGSDDGCGCDVISIDGVTFSANGYYTIDQDGYKWEEKRYQNGVEDTAYWWVSGTEVINNVDTLKVYRSLDGFNASDFTISYQACIDNEYRVYKADYPSGNYLWDPYCGGPLDLVPGETYSRTYSEISPNGSGVDIQMAITAIASSSVVNVPEDAATLAEALQMVESGGPHHHGGLWQHGRCRKSNTLILDRLFVIATSRRAPASRPQISSYLEWFDR